MTTLETKLANLLSPLIAGQLDAKTRVWMAPLTRSRSKQPGDVPWELNAEYYAQRADPLKGAAVIISEATQVSPQGKGYAFTPGIYSDEQVEGWKKVTDAVHQKGGLILAQLWHVGRISHVDLQPEGQKPVAPSAIRADSKTYTSKESGMVPTSEPRALETDEISGVVDQFRKAAANAKRAGFDGVEIHGANGYLLQQFLRSSTNKRTDDYGGSLQNRARFCLEVAHAVLEVWEPGRVGYRVSPMAEGDQDPQDLPIDTYAYLATELGKLGLAYIHVVEAFRDSARDDESEQVFGAVRKAFRDAGGQAYVGNGEYEAENAARRIDDDKADAIAFGKPFISNPDLAERFRRDAPLNEWDQSTFYGGGPEGYTDYPTLDDGPND
ncbi:MAG: alkene reductase [Phycisphaerales bacterium]|jgi:N-ethylmaleimide reductase